MRSRLATMIKDKLKEGDDQYRNHYLPVKKHGIVTNSKETVGVVLKDLYFVVKKNFSINILE